MSDPIARDSYGNPIYPIGETGFGICFIAMGFDPDTGVGFPYFTIFHQGDNYRQALFSIDMNLNGPHISNPFHDRIADYFANESWPLGAPSLREGGS